MFSSKLTDSGEMQRFSHGWIVKSDNARSFLAGFGFEDSVFLGRLYNSASISQDLDRDKRVVEKIQVGELYREQQ